MTTRRTLAEITATCTKAARGAGCPWGLAEEAGQMARTLSAHGLPGAEVVSALFDTPRACDCDGHDSGVACGLFEAASLSDLLPDQSCQFGPVAAPMLLAAACLRDGQTGQTWDLAWPGGRLRCGPAGCATEGGVMPVVAETVTVSRVYETPEGTSPDWRSRPVDHRAWARLETLAARTYVPETEASRASGAGPGTTETE